MSDPVLDLVARLPPATVAPDRAHRVHARCHRVLARRAPAPTVERPTRWRTWSRVLIGLGTLYLTEAVRQVLRVYAER